MFSTSETVGLAEWIIDDTCLVTFCFNKLSHLVIKVSFQLSNWIGYKISQHTLVIILYAPR